MRDIILKERVPESTVNEWVLSIAFIPYPDENMLEVAMNLLEGTFSPVIALSVSSLTHSYCIHHSNCQNTDSVSSIIRHLEDHFLKLMKTNYLHRETYDEASLSLPLSLKFTSLPIFCRSWSLLKQYPTLV